MGVESISYWYEPTDCVVRDLVDWLDARGAAAGTREDSYVLSGADYWIDLLIRATGSQVGMLQVRVALTNPVSVAWVLHELLSDLVDRFGGSVTDVSARRVFHDVRGAREELTGEYSSRRGRFTERFGDEILPVSADQVFDRLRDWRTE